MAEEGVCLRLPFQWESFFSKEEGLLLAKLDDLCMNPGSVSINTVDEQPEANSQSTSPRSIEAHPKDTLRIARHTHQCIQSASDPSTAPHQDPIPIETEAHLDSLASRLDAIKLSLSTAADSLGPASDALDRVSSCAKATVEKPSRAADIIALREALIAAVAPYSAIPRRNLVLDLSEDSPSIAPGLAPLIQILAAFRRIDPAHMDGTLARYNLAAAALAPLRSLESVLSASVGRVARSHALLMDALHPGDPDGVGPLRDLSALWDTIDRCDSDYSALAQRALTPALMVLSAAAGSKGAPSEWPSIHSALAARILAARNGFHTSLLSVAHRFVQSASSEDSVQALLRLSMRAIVSEESFLGRIFTPDEQTQSILAPIGLSPPAVDPMILSPLHDAILPGTLRHTDTAVIGAWAALLAARLRTHKDAASARRLLIEALSINGASVLCSHLAQSTLSLLR